MSFLNKTELETNLWSLEIGVPAADFTAQTAKVFQKQRGRINVPGFRKGKAPRHIVETLYGKDVFYEDALDNLLPELLKEAYAEGELDVVASPFDLEAKLDNAPEDITLTVKVWTKPDVTVEQYEGLEAEKDEVEASDEDIDAEITRRRQRNSRVITKEGAAEEGDIATIDFEGFADDIPFEGGKGDNYDLELGSGSFIPGFEEQVVGHSAGESFDVNVTFPEEYHAEDLAGKAVVFKVTVQEVKHKEEPELDDDFAKDCGFEDVAELREGVKTELLEQRQAHADEHFESSVIEALIDQVSGEIPPPMVEAQAKEQVQNMARNIQQQGMELEMYLQYIGQTPEEFLESQLPTAERRVRLELALEKIVAAQGYEISEEEQEAEYAKIAEQYKIDTERVKTLIPVEDLTLSLKREKALNLVKSTAKAVPPKPQETEDDAE
ncbi:MAG: trigger factor [Oscillospiraceae bacterium]|nr:trigger factor [Oscillospiraceae bacterium]